MRPCLVAWILAALLTAGSTPSHGQEATNVDGSPAAAETDSVPSGSWLTRSFKRYFSTTPQSGEGISGRALELVDKYSQHVGKPIEVVIVSQVARFDPSWDSGTGLSTRLLNTATRPVHAYTKDRIIREYLLFEQGNLLDPFSIADSERLLRDVDFINDVKITLVPLLGEIESIAVVVEVRDKWPFGVAGVIKDVGRYEASFYFSNLLGLGIRLDNRYIYRKDEDHASGYRGSLAKNNIRGTFVDGVVEYEDSWERLRRAMAFQRTLVHPAIKWVGGVAWEDLDNRNNEGIPRRSYQGDYWAGHSFSAGSGHGADRTTRPTLIPAVGFNQTIFTERPAVSPDSNRSYHDRKALLAGLTYRRVKYYKTNYLYRMGETEGIPAGLVAKVSGGYEQREFYDRTPVFAELLISSVRNSGKVLFGAARWGGYYRDHVFEEGNLWLAGGFITKLMGSGSYRHRYLTRLDYHRAINWYSDTGLMLGDRTGIRGLDNNQVEGSQRLILKLDSRIFTPWNLFGFRFMVNWFSDIGTVAGEHENLFKAKVYANLGLGIRIENPNLVLPEFEIRFLLVNNINDGGLGFDLDLGNPNYPVERIPSSRPGSFFFQ